MKNQELISGNLQFPEPRPRLLHNRTHNLRPFHHLQHTRHALLRHHVRIAHAHVERAVHLLVRDVALLLDPVEDLGGLDRVVDDKTVFAQAFEVQEAAAGHVAHAVHRALGGDLQHFAVDPGRGEELGTKRLFALQLLIVAAVLLDNPAGEREAVAVDAGRGDPDDFVPGPDLFARDDLLLVLDTKAGAGKVETVDKAAERRGLAAHDVDVRLLCALVQALPDLGHFIDGEFVGRNVVHERDRLHVHDIEVVHVHRNAVDADRCPVFLLVGNEHLGAHAVRGQGEGERAEVDEAGEMADTAHHRVFALPPVFQVPDEGFDRCCFEIDVHAGCRVGALYRGGLHRRFLRGRFFCCRLLYGHLLCRRLLCHCLTHRLPPRV